MIIESAYTLDDVLLQPAHSTFGLADANVNTFITKDIKLNIRGPAGGGCSTPRPAVLPPGSRWTAGMSPPGGQGRT